MTFSVKPWAPDPALTINWGNPAVKIIIAGFRKIGPRRLEVIWVKRKGLLWTKRVFRPSTKRNFEPKSTNFICEGRTLKSNLKLEAIKFLRIISLSRLSLTTGERFDSEIETDHIFRKRVGWSAQKDWLIKLRQQAKIEPNFCPKRGKYQFAEEIQRRN